MNAWASIAYALLGFAVAFVIAAAVGWPLGRLHDLLWRRSTGLQKRWSRHTFTQMVAPLFWVAVVFAVPLAAVWVSSLSD